ncbi:MAG: nickel-dependent lactate racemase [Paludibacter sp.]|nr:nickel-dependent lactate racemase [Paludibacter sp.]
MESIKLQYGTDKIELRCPESSIIYNSEYNCQNIEASVLLLESLLEPVNSKSFVDLITKRKSGNVVIVVSDITRPIPYKDFLPVLLNLLENSKVERSEIIILIATGMHRPSTEHERLQMFGEYVANNYQIIDHKCEDDKDLIELDGYSWSGSKVKLNRYYVEASFKIITGLVEPHFMAGFSGGRKSVCPGLAGLETVKKFHGYDFLKNPNASSTIIKENPCHNENSSIAKMCPPDFSINIVLDNYKKINQIISGELFESHLKAIDFVKRACCPQVKEQAELVISSCGGYPLDATFYQCVKGFVNCLPAVKTGGEIFAFGSCLEGIGSPEYENLMLNYNRQEMKFLKDISSGRNFTKDQWQFQMHLRVVDKIGKSNLHFFSSNIPLIKLKQLSVNGHFLKREQIERTIQKTIDQYTKLNKKIAILPEGPYCSPILN